MKPKISGILAVALLLLAGAVIASNQGFFLLRSLDGGPDTASGTNVIGLPYNFDPSVVTAKDLFLDMAVITQVARHRKSDDGFDSYTFGGGTHPPEGWNLVKGEALFVQVAEDTEYALIGSHDPSFNVALVGSDNAGSLSGTNWISVPYHTTAVTARDLFLEIGGTILSIDRWRPSDNGFDSYSFGGGTFPPDGWNLVPGEGVRVRLTSDQNWQPAHF